jgi:hypothetical protein
MTLLKLDKTGHSTVTGTDVQVEFDTLLSKGYAMFVAEQQIRSLDSVAPDAEILALAPLVGG